MPNFNFGDNLSFDRKDLFLELKSKDQKVHIRFVGGGNYDGKHFIQGEDNKWLVTYCPRIMEEAHCEYCQLFFEAQKTLKEVEETDKKKAKELEKEVRKYKAKITFYYPIINRETQKPQILKTSLSVRLALEDDLSNGIDVTQFDYYLVRTEKPGSEYYKLTRLDSSQIAEFTEDEHKALNVAKNFDLEAIVHGRESSMELEVEAEATVDDFPDKEEGEAQEVEAEQPMDATVNPDDIPF